MPNRPTIQQVRSPRPSLRIHVVPALQNYSNKVGATKDACEINSIVDNIINTPLNEPLRRPFQCSRRGDCPAVKDNNHDDPKLQFCQIIRQYDGCIALLQRSAPVPSQDPGTPPKRLGGQIFAGELDSIVGNIANSIVESTAETHVLILPARRSFCSKRLKS